MEKFIGLLKEIVSFLKTHGIDGVIWILVLLCFLGITMPELPDGFKQFFNANTSVIFFGMALLKILTPKKEKVENKLTFQEECKERFTANSNIKTELARLKSDIQADRVYIMEYHNGKSNAGTNMPFLYVDMTFEETGMINNFVNHEYQNMNTSIFNFPEYIANNLWFIGDTKKLVDVDLKIAHRMEDNKVKYCAAILLKNKNNLVGILGASFNKCPLLEDEKILQIMSIYSQTICSHLTPNSNNEKKN